MKSANFLFGFTQCVQHVYNTIEIEDGREAPERPSTV